MSKPSPSKGLAKLRSELDATPATKPQSKHHLKPFEHKQPDDPSTHNALLQAAKEPTQDPKSVATVCSKCKQPFTGGTIQGNETATWHEQCPATKPLDEQIDKILNSMSKYNIALFETDKMNGKMGWWYRFWIKIFLGARVTRSK